MVNPLREVKLDPKAPQVVDAVDEIPKPSRTLYKHDKENGVFGLDQEKKFEWSECTRY